MASHLSYVNFVCEQMAGRGPSPWRRMFGEFGLYCDGKFFASSAEIRPFSRSPPPGRPWTRTARGASPTRAAARCSCPTWRTGKPCPPWSALPATPCRRNGGVDLTVYILFLERKSIKKNFIAKLCFAQEYNVYKYLPKLVIKQNGVLLKSFF